MLVVCALVTALGVAAAAVAIVHGSAVPRWAAVATVGLTAPGIAATVLIRWLFWRTAANAVEVTARSLPALHTAYLAVIHRMGVDDAPRLFVINSNGTLTAFAAKCQVRRSYVVIGSDLVDLAYEHQAWATVEFVLAHELAHIACGHVALWRTAITALPRLVGLDRSLTRAQEYTADRVAAHHAPDGALGLLVLYAGKHLHRHVDLDGYLTDLHTGPDRNVWLRLVNLAATHPVGIRRMHALAQIVTGGGDVHGRML